ncbi:MAG: class I SAM-dependent methyltransferase [Pseudomonadota bacterium]
MTERGTDFAGLARAMTLAPLYGAGQLARTAWHTGHYLAGKRIVGAIDEPGRAPPKSAFGPVDRGRLRRSYFELMAADWRNVRNGVYRLPPELRRAPSPRRLFAASRDYVADTAKVARRKSSRGGVEARGHAAASGDFPTYFLQNFHFQTDGWLSAASADRYEMQVETLFTGAAMAMRRTALPFIADALAPRGNGRRYLDAGCGDGGFLEQVLDNFPDLDATALDLSPAYLGKARARLGRFRNVRYRRAQVEATGLNDASIDVASCVYLFHELPPKARRAAAAELARIIRPGGALVVTDTLQYGDEPRLDGLFEAFPAGFHEPFFDSYCREDLPALFGEAGFEKTGETIGLLTKSTCFRRVD